MTSSLSSRVAAKTTASSTTPPSIHRRTDRCWSHRWYSCCNIACSEPASGHIVGEQSEQQVQEEVVDPDDHPQPVINYSIINHLKQSYSILKIYSSFGSTGLSSSLLAQGFFLQNVEIFTISFGKSDEGLLVSDQENVGFPGWEGLSVGVLKVHNTDATEVSLDVDDLGDSADVVASSDVGKVSGLVGDPFDDLVLFEIVPDGVSLVDFGVGEPNGPCVVGDDVGDLVGTNSLFGHLQQLELGFSVFYLDEGESSLDVVEDSVVLVGFCDGEGIHDADGELDRSPDFIINSDSSLLVLDDDVGFARSEAEFEVVSTYNGGYLRMMARGRHSLSLWGPWLGLVA